jgi:hypothetical protein
MGAEVRLNFQVKIVFTQNWCNITWLDCIIEIYVLFLRILNKEL